MRMNYKRRNYLQKKDKKSNIYITIVMTALLSGVMSTGGIYITAPYQTEQLMKQKNYENRAQAYGKFLDEMTSDKSSATFYLVAINSLVINITSDASVQKLEDRIAILSNKNENYELFFSLVSNLQILQLYGSIKVEQYCNDFISVLLGNEYVVDWNLHSNTVKSIKDDWVENNGVVIGWKPKVDEEERAKFIILSAQYVELIKQLKSELLENNT